MSTKKLTAAMCILPRRMINEKLKMLREFCVFDNDGSIRERLSACKSEIELDRVAANIALNSLN